MGNLPFDLEIEDISALADIINEKNLGEICLEDEDIGAKLIIKSRPCPPSPPPQPQMPPVSPMAQMQPVPAGAPISSMPAPGAAYTSVPMGASAIAPAANKEPVGTTVKAPLVGIYYSSPSPDKAPFVQEGSRVRKGDILMIIESMKIMNEIPSPCDGTVLKIMARNGGAVEYDQPIMIIG